MTLRGQFFTAAIGRIALSLSPAPLATVAVPVFPPTLEEALLTGVDGSFLTGADGTVLWGAGL